MKKSFKLMAIIIAVSTIVVTGCGKNDKKVVEHKTNSEPVVTDDYADDATLKDTKSLTAKYTIPNSNENEESEEKKVLVVFKTYIKNEKTFAIIRGYDENDKLLWATKTNKYPVAQDDNFELMGTHEDRIIYRENNNFIVITAKNGKFVTRSGDLGATPVYLGFGRKYDKTGSDNYKDYIFVMVSNVAGMGCDKIIAYDYETGFKAKVYDLPEAYENYEYETKTVMGAPLDVYIEFTKYTTKNTNKNKTGFFVTDILDRSFKAKEIVIK